MPRTATRAGTLLSSSEIRAAVPIPYQQVHRWAPSCGKPATGSGRYLDWRSWEVPILRAFALLSDLGCARHRLRHVRAALVVHVGPDVLADSDVLAADARCLIVPLLDGADPYLTADLARCLTGREWVIPIASLACPIAPVPVRNVRR